MQIARENNQEEKKRGINVLKIRYKNEAKL